MSELTAGVEGVQYSEGSVFNRLIRSLGPFGFVAVDPDRVNMDDLLSEPREGLIVRTKGDPRECIHVFVTGQDESLGCLAGWISDEV